MQDWETKLHQRDWLGTRLDRILAGGLGRYTTTLSEPPDLFCPTECVLEKFKTQAHVELKHLFLAGFEGDRSVLNGSEKLKTRLSSFRDNVSRVLRPSAATNTAKNYKLLETAFGTAPANWQTYLKKNILTLFRPPEAIAASGGQRRGVELYSKESKRMKMAHASPEKSDNRDMYTLDPAERQDFMRAFRSVHTRGPPWAPW